MTFNFSKRKATDMKGNSRVPFPSKDKNLSLETLRVKLRSLFNYYVRKNFGKGGRQKCNITESQEAGLTSLRRRVKEGELIIMTTDKSGNLALRESYYEAG